MRIRVNIKRTIWWAIAAAAITGCSSGSGSAPVGVEQISNLTQQAQVAPDAVQTMPPGALTEYKIPSHHSQAYTIAPAGDGNLYFSESATNKIGRITTAGVITEFSAGGGTGPNDIRTGPDGRAWFETYGPDTIGRIDYDGSVQLYPIPSPTGHPEQIVGDAKRNAVWFAEAHNQAIGEFSLASKTFTEFPVPPPTSGLTVHPFAVALDKAGNVWFSDTTNNQVDEMSGSGTILQRLNVPAPLGPGSATLWRMTLGAEGNLWLVEISGGPKSFGAVAKINPTTGVVTTYYSPASKYRLVGPFDVVGVSGGVWVAEGSLAGIAHVGSSNGHFREYSTPWKGPVGITIGSDNNLWIVEYSGNAIGKVDLSLIH